MIFFIIPSASKYSNNFIMLFVSSIYLHSWTYSFFGMDNNMWTSSIFFINEFQIQFRILVRMRAPPVRDRLVCKVIRETLSDLLSYLELLT